MSSKCVFCKIYNKKKHYIIYENTKSFAIMNRYPHISGHILVMPKVHAPYFDSYDSEDFSDIFETIKYIVQRLNYRKYNILQNNGHSQLIYHVHFHIIPYKNPEMGLNVNWEVIKTFTDEEYTMLVEEYKKLLN